MSKKDKKRRARQNFSLKDRLEKHWNDGRWGAFVSLFMRNREASLRTPLAARWHDALYNCLTASLFVEKDLENTDMALSLIRGEAGADAPLRDCADVAADFLDARKNGALLALRPLVAESCLPACWAGLRGGLAAFVATNRSGSRKKTAAKDPEALVDKLSKQADSIGGAKTLSPFTTWLKFAQALEDATKEAPCADTFRAVRAIVGLIRALRTEDSKSERNRNSLRDPQGIPAHPLFREIPRYQTHPAVFCLWELFCRAGGRQFGEEWERAARVLRLAFAEKSHPLKKVFDRLVQTGKKSWRLILANLLTESFETDQENYVLRTLFIDAFFMEMMVTAPEEVPFFLESFGVLTKIGRRWRPQAPWGSLVQRVFGEFVTVCPPFIASHLERLDLPYESLSPVSLVSLICLKNGDVQDIRSNAGSRLPLRLTPEEVDELAPPLGDLLPSRRALRGIKSILDGESYMRLLSVWANCVAGNTRDDAVNGIPVARQTWASQTPPYMDELCALPPNDPRGCFCRLCAGMRPGSLSRDPVLVEAFFDALPADDSFGADATLFLLTWPDVDPCFILRLIVHTFPAHRKAARYDDLWTKGHWVCLAELVGGLASHEVRMLIANALLDLMQRFESGNRTAGFVRARSMLERFADRIPTGKSVRKARRTSPGQTTLPL